MSRPTSHSAVLCLLAFHGAASSSAQDVSSCYSQEQKLVASDGATHEHFGTSVSAEQDTLLVGAPEHGSAGAAYVFVRNGTSWAQQAKLLASDGAPPDNFGDAVCVNGDTALVGVFRDQDKGVDAGSAYVFVRNGTSWSQQAKLLAHDGIAGDRFGSAVALDGDTALVGAPDADLGGSHPGAVYVYVRNGATWIQEAKLQLGPGNGFVNFGRSLSLDGDVAAIGAPRPEQVNDTGYAYVYARSGSTWSQQALLMPSDPTPRNYFGASVSISGDTLVIGAFRDDHGASDAGSAYVFQTDGATWTERQKLFADDASAEEWFGHAVAISGDRVIIGAPYDRPPTRSGSAYVFGRVGSTWTQRAKLRAADAGAQDYSGWSVASSGDTTLLGSWGADAPQVSAGAAYVFVSQPAVGSTYCTCPAGPCGNSDPGAGCINSTGIGALLAAQGRTSPDEVNLVVRGLRAGQTGLFIQADNAVTLPFGDGFRCAGGALVRIGAPAPADADGSASFGPCFGDPTISSITGVVLGSGETKRYQYWYRDPNGPCSTHLNTSNGHEITW